MAGRRILVVNGDDFGLAPAVNRGIARAHEEGILTSASFMVRGEAAQEAAAYAHSHPRLGVGLHVDLVEWVYRDWAWVPLYEVVPVDDESAVRREVARQLSVFRELMGRDPTHLDSHQHVHLDEPVRAVMLEFANELEVPLRSVTSGVNYCGDFYGQTAEGLAYPEGATAEVLIRIIHSLTEGVTELACHPGEDEGLSDLATIYRHERAVELAALCDPRVLAAVRDEGIELRSFAEIASGSDGR